MNMMKIRLFLMSVMTLLISTACNSKATSNTPDGEQLSSEADAVPVKNGGKVLVVFFSHTGDNYSVGNIKVGNTKKIADLIAEKTGADMFEIKTSKYDGMAYTPLCDLAKEEQQKGELPPFEGAIENTEQYSTIFIGGPVWWGTYPQVMFTFFKKYDLNGKTLIPFTTHEGSGLGSCAKDVQKAYPNATVKKGLAIRGTDAQDGSAAGRVEKWLTELGF